MRFLICAAAVATLASCGGRPEEKTVTRTQPMAATSTIPPIDREPMPKLETATFAVG